MTTEFAVAENDPILDLDPMNGTHKRIARLLAQGITAPEIAHYIGLSEMQVRKYARRPETDEMIKYMDVLKDKQNILDRDTFDEMQSKAIRLMEQALDDENLSTESKLRLVNQILDRHPDSNFTKSQKLKHESGSKIQTNEAILELKRRAVRTDAEVIEIHTSPSSEVLPASTCTPAADHDLQHDLPHGAMT